MKSIIIFFLLIISHYSFKAIAQPFLTNPEVNRVLADNGWGYNYDSLLTDLSKWEFNPFIKISSIGKSVQNRDIWMLTINDTTNNFDIKDRIILHVRTHANEVQSFYVTRQIINILSASTDFAASIRRECLFNIIPMYNPDGVELGYARQNANQIDLERDWDSDQHQPEVQALKNFFIESMASRHQVKIALNMHGDGGAQKRYFVFHHENGTSIEYAEIEKRFVSMVQSYWPEGIAQWDAVVTWAGETPTYYPESWWWINYQETVLALTHEEVYSTNEGDYKRSADALSNGVADFLEIERITDTEIYSNIEQLSDFKLYQNYPNPFNPETIIRYFIPAYITHVEAGNMIRVNLDVYDVLGNKIAVLTDEYRGPGYYETPFNADLYRYLSSGMYVYKLTAGARSVSRKMLLLK